MRVGTPNANSFCKPLGFSSWKSHTVLLYNPETALCSYVSLEGKYLSWVKEK